MSDSTLLDFDETEFQTRPELNSHLAWESFIALAKHPNRVLVIDRTLQRREMKAGFLLALSWMVARRLLSWTDKQRVGILFPPGIGGCCESCGRVCREGAGQFKLHAGPGQFCGVFGSCGHRLYFEYRADACESASFPVARDRCDRSCR